MRKLLRLSLIRRCRGVVPKATFATGFLSAYSSAKRADTARRAYAVSSPRAPHNTTIVKRPRRKARAPSRGRVNHVERHAKSHEGAPPLPPPEPPASQRRHPSAHPATRSDPKRPQTQKPAPQQRRRVTRGSTQVNIIAMTTTADVESEQTLLNKAPARPWKRLAAAAAAASFVLGLLAATAVISSPGSTRLVTAECTDISTQFGGTLHDYNHLSCRFQMGTCTMKDGSDGQCLLSTHNVFESLERKACACCEQPGGGVAPDGTILPGCK